MKEKMKERSKLLETKFGDCNGEIYKCPHCPKTFISPTFVNAHIIRRHAYVTDLYVPPSPVHDHYRTETERLNNEIKNLKERLNETERVIRNESEKVEKKTLDYDGRQGENEIDNSRQVNNKSENHAEYKGYQEEIKNLRSMLYDEIHNLRQKEKIMHDRPPESSVQTLISQQEREFQKLKDQLFEKLTPDIESVNAKLHAQENYWMSKLEHLEKQHYKDVERLTTELKLTQRTADDMRAKYEAKVSDLERQTADQSKILIEQSKQLHSLSHEMNVSQLNERNKSFEDNSQEKYGRSGKESDPKTSKEEDCIDVKVEHINDVTSTAYITGSSNLSNNVFPLTTGDQLKTIHVSNSKGKSNSANKKNAKNPQFERKTSVKEALEYYSSSDVTDSDSVSEKEKNYIYTKHNNSTVKTDLNESNSKLDDTYNTNEFNEFVSDIKNTKNTESLENNLILSNLESSVSDSDTESKTSSPPRFRAIKSIDRNLYYKKLRASLIEAFEQKLRDLGIDPEWQGIPRATFKQKIDILKHHHKLAARKSPRYHQIKLKIIEDVLNKISQKGKPVGDTKESKRSPSHRITNVKPTAVKEYDQKRSDNYISKSQAIISNKFHSTPERSRSTKGSFENELPIKVTKSEGYKRIDRLLQVSSNSTKYSDDMQSTTNSQEYSTRRNSLNTMKSLLDSDIFKATPNTRHVTSNKSIQNTIENSSSQLEVQNIYVSPKHNKSVLKSTSGSASSLTKKKVIFDLTNEKIKDLSSSDDDIKKDELNESNWNNSSISDERKLVSQSEDYKSPSNIILKTTQSDKIAELSRKLEAQLNTVRQRPAGSVETIFTSKYMQNKENQNKMNEEANSTSLSSFLDSQLQVTASNSRKTNDSVPQPAARNLKNKMPEPLRAESISEVSDFDSDIDKILKL
ncbi:spindle pole body component 110 isoform X2 [Ceratina calcarata]|nr:spindle pole body component 110 isoform X2 [Ceratina calcarata]